MPTYRGNLSTLLMGKGIDESDLPTDLQVAQFYSSSDKWGAGTVAGSGISSIAFLVASNDADADVKAQAEFVCDGVDDDVQIQQALDALPTQGGIIKLSSGIFNIGATIEIDSYDVLMGEGAGQTLLKLQNTVNDEVIRTKNFATLTGTNSTGGAINFGLFNMRIDGNRANQTSGSGIKIYGKGFKIVYLDRRGIYCNTP